jgi:hypothetical protein
MDQPGFGLYSALSPEPMVLGSALFFPGYLYAFAIQAERVDMVPVFYRFIRFFRPGERALAKAFFSQGEAMQ